MFELLPAIMILIPRTATIGAAALFAVSLNIATGLIGLRWESLMTFAVKTPGRVDTMTVHARKITGFLPWQIDSTPAR